jgi:CRP/FNR family transcriptional regulator
MGSVGPTAQHRTIERSPAVTRRECENACASFLTDFWRGSADPVEFRQLYHLASEVELAPGQTIFSEGDYAASVFVVSKGCIRLYKHLADGRRQIVAFALPGEFLGMPIAESHNCSAEAIDQVVLCRFRHGEFVRFVQSSPNTMRRLIDFAASQLEMTMRVAMLLGYASAEERLATFLIDWRNRLGASSQFVPLPMLRRDIADFLSLKQETLSRTLAKLEAKNAIRLVPKGVVLLGLDAPVCAG